MSYFQPQLEVLRRLGALTQKWSDNPDKPVNHAELAELHASIWEMHSVLAEEAQTLEYLSQKIMSVHNRIAPAKEN